jgi:hypothetical protein
MAEVGAVFDVIPAPRTPADIITVSGEQPTDRAPGPRTQGKWLTASVTSDVIAAVFDEARRRDPDHERTWIALVDGNNHQIDQIKGKHSPLACVMGPDTLALVLAVMSVF